MKKKLNLLIIEDNDDDCLLLLMILQKDYEINYLKVETAENMLSALQNSVWDLIISDYSLPRFGGKEALEIYKSRGIDIPFLLVSGTVGEDIAAEMMKAGAHDYIMKTNLKRIVPAIERELHEVEVRKQHKEALEQLHKREEQYRTLITSMSEGLLMVDNDGRIIFTNSQFCKMLDYAEDELIGKISFDLLVHPDDRKIVQSKNELRSLGISDKYEIRMIKKDNQILWVEIAGSPTVAEDGKIIGSIGLITDITQRHIAEQALIRSEEKFRGLVERISDLVIILDKNDIVTFVTPSIYSILGFSQEEMIGKSADDFVADFNIQSVKKAMEQNKFGQSVDNLEVYVHRRDGRVAIMEFSGSSIIENNRFAGIQVVGRDITARKQMEIELQEAINRAEESSRIKSSLLANVSHELRTPMTGILGMAQLLSEEIKEPLHLEFINKIQKSGRRLMTTLNSILDLSEIESNNSLLNIRDYNLSVNSRYLLNSYERYALEKGLYYKFIVNDPDICAIADERLMNQIIINLVDNAIKFCNKGGVEIIIDSEDSNDGTFSYFIVKDSGIGISKDKLDVIFTEFRQASEGFSRRYEGAGLGLTIARKMVELMKGAITVESEIGVGSSFTVKLPGVRILPETFKSSPISENCIISNETDNEKESPYNILLVEDNTINAEVIINFLKYKSKIDHVENGSNALNKVTEKLYDLILMDINLGPGMNGIEICNRIRKIEQYKYIPIIALTGYTLSDDRDNLLTSGFDNYIAKPFTKDEIIKIVDKTLKL